jgi:poly(A) polymerase
VGKPRTVGRTPDRYTFYYHEHVGARVADEICQRLKLSNAERQAVVWLVEKHQFLAEAPRMRPHKLKTTLAQPHARELLALHRADALASGKGTEHVDYCERLLRDWTPEDLDPAPLATGEDLMELGVKPAPLYKRVLDRVREAQLDGTIKTREEALELIKRLLEDESAGPT